MLDLLALLFLTTFKMSRFQAPRVNTALPAIINASESPLQILTPRPIVELRSLDEADSPYIASDAESDWLENASNESVRGHWFNGSQRSSNSSFLQPIQRAPIVSVASITYDESEHKHSDSDPDEALQNMTDRLHQNIIKQESELQRATDRALRVENLPVQHLLRDSLTVSLVNFAYELKNAMAVRQIQNVFDFWTFSQLVSRTDDVEMLIIKCLNYISYCVLRALVGVRIMRNDPTLPLSKLVLNSNCVTQLVLWSSSVQTDIRTDFGIKHVTKTQVSRNEFETNTTVCQPILTCTCVA